MQTDIEIARSIKLKKINEVAESAGILEDELEHYGKYKAKVSLDILKRLSKKKNGKYIDVTAITPTPLGEGKTVTTIGLGLGLNKIGKKAFVCLRQPSMGPTFGIKGGAAGGGHSQIIPMEDFNLHLTGDIHAVGVAHNLLSAIIDASLHHNNPHSIDQYSITWKRVLDLSDRALRNIVIGLGSKINGPSRETGFDITVASEIMAILALTTDMKDMRKRLGKIIIGLNKNGDPITAEELKCAGAMAVLLKDAILPTLMQTTENTPCFVHTGPFANIAHGNSSIIADKIALKLADYVVTESGFGADCGCEKFMDIKCRYSGLVPDAVVLVATVRALKMHSGKYTIAPGKPLDRELLKEDTLSLKEGICNLEKQIENVRLFGIPVVVAVNKFPTDTEQEYKIIKEAALACGAEDCIISEVHAKGGEGGRELAEAVVKACEKPKNFQYLYPLDMPIIDKITTICKKVYGADGVDLMPLAKKQISNLTEMGFEKLPICMAKTHLSLSHKPELKGRPTGFEMPVIDVRISAGAGFIYALTGEIMTMPGLPSHPSAMNIDLDENGNIVGLF